MKVLIVEDEVLIALHLEMLVQELGHGVCAIALSADEAVALQRTIDQTSPLWMSAFRTAAVESTLPANCMRGTGCAASFSAQTLTPKYGYRCNTATQ